MAVLNGYRAVGALHPTGVNPFLSSDLSAFAFDEFPPHASDGQAALYSPVVSQLPVSAAPRALDGYLSHTFYSDYYERIHLSPVRLELGTVANAVTRSITVWNAYTRQQALLDDILIQNGVGISVIGDTPPLAFNPLQEKVWDIRITPNGPPEINAQVQFDFSNVDDPRPVVIVGNRAVVLPAIPEVPVVERWRWLTDVHTSFDGTEQRVGLLSVPRRSQVTRLVFDDEAQLREQYKTLLSAAGRLFVPYFQYTAITTAPAVAGDSVLAFDTSAVDLRDDDYVLLMDNENARLVQLDTVGTTTATTRAPLSFDVAKGTKVIAIFASILPNELNLQRPHVNSYGSMTLTSSATYPRSQHQRPASAATFNTLAGYFILERHPLANDDIDHNFDTGQEILDAKTGLFDVATDWDFTRVESSFEFKTRRVGPSNVCVGMTGPQEMDYWRLFGDEMKGSLNSFLLSTYRPDQVLAVPVGDAANSMLFVGPSYVDNFWPAIPYHYLAITTASGIHYAEVTGASKNVDNDSAVSISPAIPAGAGWADVQQVSYLLKQRIVGDIIELEHFALETLIKFRARTIKE
jgi:hypothetical protein